MTGNEYNNITKEFTYWDGRTITLNKEIRVYLSKKSLDTVDRLICADDYLEFQDRINNQAKIIITTQTRAINSAYFEMGYNIIVVYNNGFRDYKLSFLDLLLGKIPNMRELRLSHNWEKMIFSCVFSDENFPFNG